MRPPWPPIPLSFGAICVAVLLHASALHAGTWVPDEVFPEDVATGSSADDGPIYTTHDGRALYVTKMDETASGKPGCGRQRYDTGTHHLGEPYRLSDAMRGRQKTCLEKWPPFVPSSKAVPVGKWTILRREEGFAQWAHAGRPVYTSTRDERPGDVNGTFNTRGWQTVRVPLGFPPGFQLVRTIGGLLLGTGDEEVVFALNRQSQNVSEDAWTPVVAPQVARAYGEWSVVKTRSGVPQWAFRGKPLYLPAKTLPGKQIADAISAATFATVTIQAAMPAPRSVSMQYSVAGWVHATGDGRTLYTFSCEDETPGRLPCDQPGDPAVFRSSICGSPEQCSREWRPLRATGGESRAGEWAVADVPDPPFREPEGAYGEGVPRVRAWTYRGAPVYTFIHDQRPGDIRGHSVRYYGVSRFAAVKVLGNRHGDAERFFTKK